MSNLVEPVLKMLKSNQSKFVAVSAILAGLAIGYSLLNRGGSSRKSTEIEGLTLTPALTEEQTVAIMTAVIGRVKSLSSTTMHNAKKIKDDIMAEGHHVDNETLRQTYILPNFEKGYQEIQTFVFNDFEVDEVEVEEAMTYYKKAGNTDLEKISDEIRKVFVMFGGKVGKKSEVEDDEESDDENTDDEDEYDQNGEETLDEGEVLKILDTLAQSMVGHTIDYAEEFKRKYGLPNSSTDLMDAFLQGITRLSEEAEKLVLRQCNFTLEQFKEAFHRCKVNGSPAIDKAVMKMKVDNQALLRSQGIMI